MTSSTSTDWTLSSSPSPLDTGVMILFVPLLRSLEYGLYKEVIVTACQKYHPDGLAFGIQILCSIIAKHTSTLFCTAFCDTGGDTSMEDRNEAASRLVDVCLVSHPLFPLYLAVSILAVRKQRNGGRLCKWHSREDLSGQFTNLFYLNTIPTTGTDNAEHALTSTPLSVVVEEIISKCLHYMYVPLSNELQCLLAFIPSLGSEVYSKILCCPPHHKIFVREICSVFFIFL